MTKLQKSKQEKPAPKKTKRPVMQGRGHSDSMQTPTWALEPLFKYMDKNYIYWEPACGKGYLVDEMRGRGYKVKWSDIARDPREDFFKFEPKQWDVIITNPPFSEKNEWLERCYKLGKPFALLLPYTALETPARQALFRCYGIEVIFMDKRVSFETPNGGSSSWFPTAWFTRGLGVGKQMEFYEYPVGYDFGSKAASNIEGD